MSLPVENLLPQNVVGSIINYLQESTEAAHKGTPSCSRPQPATDNGVRDGRSNSHPPPSLAVPPETLMHSINQCSLSRKSTLWLSVSEATTLPMLPLRALFSLLFINSRAIKLLYEICVQSNTTI